MRKNRGAWIRRYPPLTAALGAVVLAAFVLPSALNVPLSNPGETLELAPVPPDDEVPPVQSGNLPSLSLGTSAGPAGAGPNGDGPGGAGDLPPPIPEGAGDRPATKRCVGSPPRQTEDPLSPPCVAHFEGDNGGSTYRGVDAEEIRILFYHSQQGSCGTSRSCEQSPRDTYVDLDKPPSDDEYINVRALRRFQRYFNDRYQTYGRRVHFFVYFDPGSDRANSPETRRADARENIEKIDPMAVLSYPLSFEEEYISAVAQQKVLNFGSRFARPQSLFQRNPGMVWGYPPSLEQQAASFSSFVCRRVVGYRASSAGDVDGDRRADDDKPRKLGLLHAAEAARPQFTQFANHVRDQVEACGGRFAATGTYPHGGETFQSSENQVAATENIAEFRQAGVTTIVWPQGYETEHSKAAGRANYRPEWVIAGDGGLEGYGPGLMQDQDTWDQHAWVVTPMVGFGPREETYCWGALVEADPEWNDTDRGYACGLRTYYEDLRQLFTGIQVAGPSLTPDSIDQGFRAIPPHRSTDPLRPACFYDPGDYTCVKDATWGHWDRSGPNASGLDGCYRLAEGGLRYTAAHWPKSDGLAVRDPEGPCLTWQGGIGGIRLPS